MPPLQRGLYEQILTDLLIEELRGARGKPVWSDLRNAEAADRIAWHLARVVERAIEAYPEADRAREGARLATELIDRIVASPKARALATEQLIDPPQVLRSIRALLPDGKAEDIMEPLIPLLDTTLLTNAPGEPNVGHQVRTEIASADRIDVVMAFIRRSGILSLREPLRRHVESGRSLRVLTTTYTGSTEVEALELLSELGA
jgi:phosphohistidine phosphatase SixA